jgi:nucleoside-diphosphate-sugar epimerase
MVDVGDGGMGWIDVEDVARVHVDAMQPGATGRYLVVNESHDWIDIAAMMGDRFPKASVTKVKRPGDALKPEFDITRTKVDLGYKPSRSVQESLERLVMSLVDADFLSKDILT